MQNQEVEDSVSNTDIFNAELLIEELKAYSSDGEDVVDQDINEDGTYKSGEPYVELILRGN